ncbi:MAG: nicotinate-nucleotide adenylyltransferase, partial [Actinomycetota bacterium]|nr:nicotinate-nucleotide adenylyltransferase [Actinomycetota bacterium]
QGRIGVMGGTFDPPHNGHFHIATEVASAKQLDQVIFVPASQPWQKSGYSDAEDRLAMTALGAARDPRFRVSRIEIERAGPTYTIDTIAELLEQFPGAELFLILGADAASNLGTWHRANELARYNVQIIAVPRPGFDVAMLETRKQKLPFEVIEVPPVNVSSTEVRAAVQAGRSIEGLVPPEVAAYIKRHHLYKDGPVPR